MVIALGYGRTVGFTQLFTARSYQCDQVLFTGTGLTKYIIADSFTPKDTCTFLTRVKCKV